MNGTTANQIGQALGMWAVIASLFFGLGLFGFSITAVILACLRRNRGWTVAAAISVSLVLGLLGAGAWASYTQFQKALMPKKVTAADGIASLQVPGSWKELNNRNKDASIKQGNSFREEYMMVISESKDTLRGVELDDYTRMVCTQIEAGMKKATHAPIGPLVIHGLPACRARLAGFSKSNLQLVYLITTVDDGKNFHQVIGWTAANKESAAMPVLRETADTFEVAAAPITKPSDKSKP